MERNKYLAFSKYLLDKSNMQTKPQKASPKDDPVEEFPK